MPGIQAASNHSQIYSVGHARNMGPDRAGALPSAANQDTSVKPSSGSKIETKGWSPIDSKSSLIPRTTEYGHTIGDVQLSDKAKDYYETLKSKYHNMEFIAVSKDAKNLVAKNAAAYGNANKMVVLIDEEKIERMAADESFRKKYEGIIASASLKMTEAKNSLAGTGASIKNFGMSVDANGKESFFATVEKAGEQQRKRIEKKAAEKKAQKALENKKAETKARRERLENAKEKRAEKDKKPDRIKDEKETRRGETAKETEEKIQDKIREGQEKEYVTIEADTFDALVSKVQSYSYDNALSRVMTDAEKVVGSHIDFRG